MTAYEALHCDLCPKFKLPPANAITYPMPLSNDRSSTHSLFNHISPFFQVIDTHLMRTWTSSNPYTGALFCLRVLKSFPGIPIPTLSDENI